MVLFVVYGIYRHFQQYISYIMAVSFIGGGNRSTWRKLPTCHILFFWDKSGIYINVPYVNKKYILNYLSSC